MPSRVLIIEDEPDIRKTIDYNLSKESFEVVQAASIQEGERVLASNKIDVIILDLMLPDGSGLTLCRDIKSDSKLKHIPVIILTAKTEEVDRVVGFELGADDYVTKPFSQKELNARIKSLLRRSKPQSSSDIVEFTDLKIDRITKRVYRKDKEITLGPTEFKLLDFFIKNPKRVYSREQLLNNVWGENIYVESRTVDVHIRRLRQAINIQNTKPLIRTVRSAGYSLES